MSHALTEPETTLIADLDKRQEAVLESLDSLNDRVLATLEEWSVKDDTAEQSDLAVAPIQPSLSPAQVGQTVE